MKLSNPMRPVWNIFQLCTMILFKALGLHVIVSTFRSLRHLTVGKGYNQPTKIAIRKSRTIALMRVLVHVAPMGVAMWEVIINWNTYYLGANIRNQAYYQFGAKIHEMTVQASLATIVLSYVRYELSLGQGLPFGALFSGLQISQASFLWSREFLGSICSKRPIRRRIGMVLIIIAAIVLAATVGPSSAILLIPRLEYWPAGATNIWLNVTSQELWPDRTNDTLVPRNCLVSDPLAVDKFCPSNGWQAIELHLSLGNGVLPFTYQSEYGYASVPYLNPLAGTNSLRQLLIAVQTPVITKPGSNYVTALATTQQAAVADALSTTGAMWNLAIRNITTKGHGSVLDQRDAVHSINTDYYQPYTLASCAHDTIFGYEDQNPVAFPTPPGSTEQMLNTSNFNDSILSCQPEYITSFCHAFIYPGVTRSQILDTSGPPGDYRLRWVELPKNSFNGSAIGAVVLLPRASENSTTQEVLMCNLGAGWGTSKINTSTFDGASQTVLSEVTRLFIRGNRGDNGTTAPTSEENAVSHEVFVTSLCYQWCGAVRLKKGPSEE